MAKHFFSQATFQAPYATLLIADLRAALIDHRLDGTAPSQVRRQAKAPFSGDLVWVRSPKTPAITIAEEYADTVLIEDLISGKLAAYVHKDEMDTFRLVPTTYWKNDFARSSLKGYLKDHLKYSAVPQHLVGNPVCVIYDDARLWLKSIGITEADSFFPSQLRDKTADQKAKKRWKWAWGPFEIEAVRILRERGGLSRNWRQAALETEMLEWCQREWGDEPSPRSARNHVKTAIAQYRAGST